MQNRRAFNSQTGELLNRSWPLARLFAPHLHFLSQIPMEISFRLGQNVHMRESVVFRGNGSNPLQ